MWLNLKLIINLIDSKRIKTYKKISQGLVEKTKKKKLISIPIRFMLIIMFLDINLSKNYMYVAIADN